MRVAEPIEQIRALDLAEIEILGDSARGDWSPPPTFALAHPGNWGQWLLEGAVPEEKGVLVSEDDSGSDGPERDLGPAHFYDIADFIDTHHLEGDPRLI